jgi:uncharacterized membrane protein
MRSKFAISGHPIHPALVALPIGLFVWSFIANVIYVFSDENMTWYDIAFWSGVAAVVTALLAALPGFGDYMTMARATDARDVATAHMVLNLTVVGLFVVSLALMLDENAASGTALGAVVALHAVANGLLALSGWLGGELVFRHHLGVVPEDSEVERAERSRHELRAAVARRNPHPRG